MYLGSPVRRLGLFCYVNSYCAGFKHVADKSEYRKLDPTSVPGFSGDKVGTLFVMSLVIVQDSNM